VDTPRSLHIPLGTGLTYHVLSWPAARDDEVDHTVLLIHGFLDLSWGWEETVRAGLRGGFHLFAPDMRGHGDSGRIGPGGYYHFADYIADLADLIEALRQRAPRRMRRLSLVGHSMGGSIASYYAGTYPDQVHRLALLEGLGPPEDSSEPPDRMRTWIAAWRKARGRPSRGYPDVAAAAAQLRRHDPLLDEPLALRLAERGTRRDADGRLRFKHDPLHLTPGPLGFRWALAEGFARRVACPVLIVEGAESPFRYAGAEAERRHQAFRDRRHAVVPGAAHMMQRHQPALLAQLLCEFLGGTA
jgi:pimeloyl-ACP methyl ester carboxylesterase